MSKYADCSDFQLLELLKSSDHVAFAEIYDRYWKKLFVLAGNKVECLEDAEEIVQNIFLSLWNRRTSLNITSSLAAYLSVSVKYRVIKVLQKQFHQNGYAQVLKAKGELDDATQEWLQFTELQDQLEKLVTELPEKCRLVFRLCREAGLSQKQIARELDISEKTVEAHLGKAIKKLRAGLRQFFLTLL